jgi:hypothetical protein
MPVLTKAPRYGKRRSVYAVFTSKPGNLRVLKIERFLPFPVCFR